MAFPKLLILPNTLDLFFTSIPSLVQQCTPLSEISDHCAILTTVKLENTYQEQKSAGYKVYFGNKLANWQEMKDNMIQFSSCLLQDYTIETPVGALWSQIYNHLLHHSCSI